MNKNSKIYVAGHNGLVGSAIVRYLEKDGYYNLICKTSREVDLRNSYEVSDLFATSKPEYIFLAAAKVGGINANNIYKADFIYDNLSIQNNVIHNAYKYGVKKLLFLGSSCIYPKNCAQPIKEDYLLSSELELTNEAYAIAKIAGIKMCQAYHEQHGCDFISVMPTNLYGPGDNYHPYNSHVLPALIRKFHEAKLENKESVKLWGDGTAYREFLFSDDLAEACVFLMNNYSSPDILNIGTGKDITIKKLAKLVKEMIGFTGKIEFDTSMPNGTQRKLLDVKKINKLGWKAKTPLVEGLKIAYEDFLKKY